MSFFKRIANLLSGSAGREDDRFLDIYVLSHRCREPLTGRVDLFNELSRDDDEGGFYTRKVLHATGAKRCFDQVEVYLWFDKNKRLGDHNVTGGAWLSAEEYAEQLAIFNAPPEEEAEPEDGSDEEAKTKEANDE